MIIKLCVDGARTADNNKQKLEFLRLATFLLGKGNKKALKELSPKLEELLDLTGGLQSSDPV